MSEEEVKKIIEDFQERFQEKMFTLISKFNEIKDAFNRVKDGLDFLGKIRMQTIENKQLYSKMEQSFKNLERRLREMSVGGFQIPAAGEGEEKGKKKKASTDEIAEVLGAKFEGKSKEEIKDSLDEFGSADELPSLDEILTEEEEEDKEKEKEVVEKEKEEKEKKKEKEIKAKSTEKLAEPTLEPAQKTVPKTEKKLSEEKAAEAIPEPEPASQSLKETEVEEGTPPESIGASEITAEVSQQETPTGTKDLSPKSTSASAEQPEIPQPHSTPASSPEPELQAKNQPEPALSASAEQPEIPQPQPTKKPVTSQEQAPPETQEGQEEIPTTSESEVQPSPQASEQASEITPPPQKDTSAPKIKEQKKEPSPDKSTKKQQLAAQKIQNIKGISDVWHNLEIDIKLSETNEDIALSLNTASKKLKNFVKFHKVLFKLLNKASAFRRKGPNEPVDEDSKFALLNKIDNWEYDLRG
ncbi:MAG: hypothetical protein R6U96_02040 [Promethearchaeia archaeon]